jgi:transposase-like protein
MPARSEQSQDPHLWPASQRRALVQELARGRDTLAGLAHRHGLPVPTLLQWWAEPRDGRETLLMPGVGPLQSRAAGPS